MLTNWKCGRYHQHRGTIGGALRLDHLEELIGCSQFAMKIQNLSPFGVELLNFDVRTASKDELFAFVSVFHRHSLVLIRSRYISPDHQLEILSHLGEVIEEVQDSGTVSYVSHDPLVTQGPDFGKGELLFHFDLPATDDWPYHIISLYGETVTTTGGETLFAHGGVAHDRLSASMKAAMTDLRAVHIADPYAPPTTSRPTEDDMGSFAERGVHPVLQHHPYGRGQILTIDYATTSRIVGMSELDSAPIFASAFDALYNADATYIHKWNAGDLLIWDNRVVQHARREFPLSQARKLRRVVIGDGVSVRRRYQRWFEQIPTDPNSATKYCRGRVLYPGDPGIWFGMKR